MSKITLLNYNSSSTASCCNSDIQELDITSDEDFKESIIINNKQISYSMPTITNLFLNFPLPLEKYWFNTLKVKDNLNIDLFINCPYSFLKLYNLVNCNIGGDNDDYFYYVRTPKITSCKLFGILMEQQFNIY
jgi:hypothetical protein